MSEKTYNERRGVPSCSNLERLAACPASYFAEKNAVNGGASCEQITSATNTGTKIHNFLETRKREDLLSMGEKDLCAKIIDQEEEIAADFFGDEWKEAFHPHAVFREIRLGVTTLETVVEVEKDDGFEYLITGKADLILAKNRKALVIDYKTGRGDVEHAAENAQLRGLAAMAGYFFDVDEIRVAIIQPNAGKPTIADFDRHSLRLALDWLVDVAQTATDEDMSKRHLSRNMGDHCQYCKAKAACPALHQLANEARDMVAGDDKKEITQAAYKLSNLQISQILQKRKVISWFLNAVEFVAKLRIEEGQEIEGFSLKETRPTRKVTDAQAAFSALEPLGLSVNGMLRACSVSLPTLEEELRVASGIKEGTEEHAVKKYNLTAKAAKEKITETLGDLIEVKQSGNKQLIEL